MYFKEKRINKNPSHNIIIVGPWDVDSYRKTIYSIKFTKSVCKESGVLVPLLKINNTVENIRRHVCLKWFEHET